MERRYDTILWDVDGTLLNFNQSMRYALTETFLQYGIEIDDEIIRVYSKINDSYWKRLERKEIQRTEALCGRFLTLFRELSEKGSLQDKKIDSAVLERIDIDEFRMSYQRYLGSVYYYQDDSFKVCSALKQKGYHQFIITNGVTWTQQNKLRLAGFYDVMDDIFISEQIGFDKPDVRFFEGCFQRMKEKGFSPDIGRMLVIGDSKTSDMQGARNVGIDCCLYMGPVTETSEGNGQSQAQTGEGNETGVSAVRSQTGAGNETGISAQAQTGEGNETGISAQVQTGAGNKTVISAQVQTGAGNETRIIAQADVSEKEQADYVLYDLRNVEEILCQNHPIRK